MRGDIKVDKIKLIMSAAVEYENVIYFSPVYINGLFKLDLETKKISFICRFDEREVCYALYRFACIYKNEIWFIPYHASKIAIVNMQTFAIEYISPLYHKVVKAGVKYRGGMLYCKAEIIKEKCLCLIPSSVDSVLIINMETRELIPFYDVIKADEFLDGGAYDPIQDCIWMQFTQGKNGILKLSLIDGKIERYGYPFNERNYGFYYYQESLFMSPGNDGYIRSINTNNLHITSYPIEKENDKERYFWMISSEDELWFLPGDEPKIMVWDKISKQTKIKRLEGNFDKNIPFSIVSIPSKDKIIFTTEYTNCIYIYNDTNILEKIEVEWIRDNICNDIEKNVYGMGLKKMQKEGIYFEDSSCLNINVFIDFIDILNENQRNTERNGNHIYRNINV